MRPLALATALLLATACAPAPEGTWAITDLRITPANSPQDGARFVDGLGTVSVGPSGLDRLGRRRIDSIDGILADFHGGAGAIADFSRDRHDTVDGSSRSSVSWLWQTEMQVAHPSERWEVSFEPGSGSITCTSTAADGTASSWAATFDLVR